jgi:hypothetical protein
MPLNKSVNNEVDRKKTKRLEPMIGYKYPPTASGATYIRGTGGAPNDREPTG